MPDLSAVRLPLYFIYTYVNYSDTNEYKTSTAPIRGWGGETHDKKPDLSACCKSANVRENDLYTEALFMWQQNYIAGVLFFFI